MIKIDTSRRSTKSEIMDDFHLDGNELRRTLKDLDKINKWLGGNKITLNGLNHILKNNKDKEIVSIVDLGCGNGSILRKIADWGRKKKVKLEITGLDANPHAISIAKELSSGYPEISFICMNIFDQSFKEYKYDIILCTLTLHHFKDDEIITILRQLYEQSSLGIVINDLHRNKLAFTLFKAFCAVFINNEIARKDGLTSILRGFTKRDLERYIIQMQRGEHQFKWKWAFRYQWIIEKENS